MQATVLCDIVVLYVLQKKYFYREKKYLLVDDTGSESDDYQVCWSCLVLLFFQLHDEVWMLLIQNHILRWITIVNHLKILNGWDLPSESIDQWKKCYTKLQYTMNSDKIISLKFSSSKTRMEATDT